MKQIALSLDGICAGPLFGPITKVRPAKRKARGWRWYYLRNQAATPRWATGWKIAFIYSVARLRSLSVDHIVPIGHPLVCGLHVEHNLQLLSVEENCHKGNNWWPGMWGEQERLL